MCIITSLARIFGKPLLFVALACVARITDSAENTEKHYVPADKQLSQEWVDNLYDRGERKVYRGSELLTIGMPCGGIGAGQLYVRGDGTLARWWIFNEGYITDFRKKDPNTGYRTYRPPSELDQGFAIAIRTSGGKAFSLPLSHDGFGNIGFIGDYPIATIKYEGAKAEVWPIEVTGEVFSPYIPLNSKDSGLPTTVLRYMVKSTSGQPVSFRIGGWLQNGVMPTADDSVKGKRRNRVFKADGVIGVSLDLVAASVNSGDKKNANNNRVEVFDSFEDAIVRADGTSIESGSLEQWITEGERFPQRAINVGNGRANWLKGVRGYDGKHLASSGDADAKVTCKLTSQPFTLKEPHLAFLIGSIRRERWVNGELPSLRLLVDGKIVRSAMSDDAHGKDKQLRIKSWNVSEFVGKEVQLEIVDQNITCDLLVDNIQQSSFDPVNEATLPVWRPDFGNMTFALLGEAGMVSAKSEGGVDVFEAVDNPVEESESSVATNLRGAIASTWLELAPGEEKSITFVVSWYFPNYVNNQKGCPGDVGRMYSNWFSNSQEVVQYIADNFERLDAATHTFRDTLYLDTTLPYWLVQRAMAPNANLASATVEWWKNGRMYSWEGVGFCLGTCGHVWNYAQGPSRLFPEFERSVRLMQDFDPEVSWKPTGRINFRGFNDTSESFEQWGYIPDAQCGYVLKAYREHLMSPDTAHLNELWPRIKQSTEYLIERDGRYGEVNGVLEGMQHLTDSLAWGPNTFTGSMYLAALRASEEMALQQGDAAFAQECRELSDSGQQWTLKNLWNGEYFIHKYSPAPKGGLPRDSEGRAFGDGCLSDQMFGQNWAHQLGLGYIYPADRVKQSLQSVFKYNWAPDVGDVYKVRNRRFILLANPGEPGLMGCTFPYGAPVNLIGQNEDPWTGYEYQSASGMIWEGLLTEGLTIAYGVHQRYDGAKHNPWCEIEGGDHYSRSMASWGMLLAASGYEYDGPAGKIGFAPRLTPDDFRSLFTAAEGWGTLVQQRSESVQANRIEVRWGKLKTKILVFEVPEGFVVEENSVTLAGKPLDHEITQQGCRVVLTLDSMETVGVGETLRVEMTCINQ